MAVEAAPAPRRDTRRARSATRPRPPREVGARLRWRWLPYRLLSPWTLLLPVAAFGALFNLLGQIGLEQQIGRVVGRAAEGGVHRADTEPWWAALLLSAGGAGRARLIGAVGASLQFTESWWRFRLTREPGGTLHRSRGLLTSRSVTIEQRLPWRRPVGAAPAAGRWRECTGDRQRPARAGGLTDPEGGGTRGALGQGDRGGAAGGVGWRFERGRLRPLHRRRQLTRATAPRAMVIVEAVVAAGWSVLLALLAAFCWLGVDAYRALGIS